MKILHLLTSGGIGGIETLSKDIATYSTYDNSFCFLFGEGIIYDQMEEEGRDVYSLYNGSKLSYSKLHELEIIAKFCDIIVVHHDDPFLKMYYLALKYIYPHKKFVSMIHHCYDPVADNLNYGIVKKGLNYFITSRAFRISDRLIFVSKGGLNSYIGHFKFNREKACVVYNGISNKFIEEGKCVKKRNSNCVKLLYVGRLVGLKGVNVLIDILPEIMKNNNLYVDVVGDGRSREELENKVREYGIQDRVMFHGFKRDVRPYLKQADIFVYPSKTEIFGISLVEAMSFKCICVASNVGGIPEIITDGVNGYLNMDNSSEGLKNSIVKAILLVSDNDKREKMMLSAEDTAEKFTIDKTISSLEKIYEEMMDNY